MDGAPRRTADTHLTDRWSCLRIRSDVRAHALGAYKPTAAGRVTFHAFESRTLDRASRSLQSTLRESHVNIRANRTVDEVRI